MEDRIKKIKLKIKVKKNQLKHYQNLLKNIEKYPKYKKKNVEQVISELETELNSINQ